MIAVSIGGGVLIPQAELKSGSFEWLLFTSNPKGYVLSNPGYIIGGKIKFDFPTLPVTLVGLISYSALSTDTTITIFSPIHTPEKSTINLSGKIITVGAGFEYGLFQRSPVKPYVGSEISLNILSGNVANLPFGISRNIEIKSAWRFGAGAGLGCQIEIPSLPFAVEVEAKYRLANLLGKDYNIPIFVDAMTRHLNDGKDPQNQTRSINYISIDVGFSFALSRN